VSMLVPLSLAIPMIVAAALVAISPLLARRLVDSLAVLAAGSVVAMSVIVLFQSIHAPRVYWFGGWGPHNGHAIGICFVADPFSAGLVTLVAVLVLGTMVFSWRYFDEVGTLYHALMMVFMAAMIGFVWSGDVFNLFVFFELMSVTAYALTGYKIEEEAALEGAINFAVTNSEGALFP
jgi:multicomponent Na+:H+ antiporter subunit D